MRNLRIKKKLPTTHQDFKIVLGFVRKASNNKHIWKNFDFGLLSVSQTVVEPDDPSPQDRYLISGVDKSIFEELDYTSFTWTETGQPNIRTECIIYCYERHKATQANPQN